MTDLSNLFLLLLLDRNYCGNLLHFLFLRFWSGVIIHEHIIANEPCFLIIAATWAAINIKVFLLLEFGGATF
jgi:hypothetical protein